MKQAELLQSQTNVENQDKQNSGQNKNTQLIQHKQLEGTPFWLHYEEEKGHYVTFGKYLISEYYETEMEIYEWLNEEEYNIICKMMICIIEQSKPIK